MGQRDFLIGVVYAAWWLHSAHGLDSVAEEMLRTAGPVERLQRIALAEQYEFKRGFWAEVKRMHRYATGAEDRVPREDGGPGR